MKKVIQLISVIFKEKYFTRDEVSKLLTICLSTINNWIKKGILQPYQIGGRVYFKASDIESSMIKLVK